MKSTKRMLPHRCDGLALRRFVAGGLEAIEGCAEALDRLNVFPVPDADTGRNLRQTLRSAAGALASHRDGHLGNSARELSEAALRGAQGNSGVILAQIFVGLSDAFHGRPDAGARGWARGWQAAAEAAYAGVGEPREGTILTVVRRAAESAETTAADGGGLEETWRSMARASAEAAAETRYLLPQLERAGVVDAGGLGLALMLRGGLAAFTGDPMPLPGELPVPSEATLRAIRDAEFPRYCTEMLVTGDGLRRELLERGLHHRGDSVDLIWLVEDGGTPDRHRVRARIHLHTDHPREVADWVATMGEVSGFKADDLEAQRKAFLASGERREAVVAGVARKATARDAFPRPPAFSAPRGRVRQVVRVVTDSSSDLAPETAAELGITVVPAVLTLGEESFLDGVEITAETFYRRLLEEPLRPTTSQPPPGRFADAYRDLAQGAAGIVSIHISDRLSGTGNSARQGARSSAVACPVEVVDSGSTSTGLGLVVLEAAHRARRGASFEEVVAAARSSAAGSRARFTVDTLEFLARGGRIGRARKLLGDLLGVRPVLEVRDGVVVPAARVRSRRQALEALRRFAEENRPLRRLSVLYTTGRGEAEALARELAPLAPEDPVLVAQVGPALGSHLGPGTLGVALLRAG